MKTSSERRGKVTGALRAVPYMGVIYVVAEAVKRGFVNGHPDWCNLGQGQPEVGEMDGAPERIATVELEPGDHAYGPIEGTPELREAVAAHYNRLYRRGKGSQYTAANVCIAQGGRPALTRAFAALGDQNIGFQLPDYTAYEDLFNLVMSRVTPIPLRAHEEDGFCILPDRLDEAARDAGLGAYLVSNPCNPTGNAVQGEDLERLVAVARKRRMTLLLDEFYSHFHYTPDGEPAAGPISAAPYIEDVEKDPVLLFDGLTKSYRYPGWRVGWILGPASMIENLARAGSALDGGPSRIAQRAALKALEPAQADQETQALREGFAIKRNLMLRELESMGVRFAHPGCSTFYLWGSLEGLPKPFDDAMTFFQRALERKVMTVPGEFFDVDPGGRRAGRSPYKKWMRFSFGPPRDNVELGLRRLRDMLDGRRNGS